MFGEPGTQYDFSGNDMQQIRKSTVDLENFVRDKKKKVNPKVMNMIDE